MLQWMVHRVILGEFENLIGTWMDTWGMSCTRCHKTHIINTPATCGELGCLRLGNGTDHIGPFQEAVCLTVFVKNIEDEVLGVLLPMESPP